MIDSIDREELAKFFALKNDPEDEEAEVLIHVPNALSYSHRLLLNKFPIYTKLEEKNLYGIWRIFVQKILQSCIINYDFGTWLIITEVAYVIVCMKMLTW